MQKADGVGRNVIERKVVSMGETLYVCIPKDFAQRHEIKAGDVIPMIINTHSLKLVPHEKP